tara:strand:+ start:540 stop:998 length:459 start_codon:yes stop_codon:yes gene_type:complete
MNTVEAVHDILFSDLETLRAELLAYPQEDIVWKVLPGTTNSAGVLFVHLTRSLRHFIGSSFGQSGFLRQRDEEFLVRDIPLADMIAEFDIMIKELKTAFGNIDPNKLDNDFPVSWREGKFYPTHFMLMRMIAHVNYHMGQVNYHRRFFSTAQ